jgi:hypothetical protein
MMPPTLLKGFGAPLATVLLLGGVWADRLLFHLPPGDPAAYHERVRATAERLPRRIGEWVGTEVQPPESAVSLLKPNLLQGIRFENAATRERASLMVVQCGDARDMGGHWPPVCYPAHGWTLRASEKRVIPLERGDVPVTVYRFTKEALDRYEEIVVYNFFVRPDGALEDGGGGVRKAAEDPRMKVFGATQFQVVFESSMPEARRTEVFQTIVGGVSSLIDVMLDGVPR